MTLPAAMRAVRVTAFGERPEVVEVPRPEPGPRDVLVRVVATGLCRSDVHAWRGDDDNVVPYTPGHEFAGVVAAVGSGVDSVTVGDRVTAPFVAGCGVCADCRSGQAQVCRDQQQPGFTYDGSFADYVLLKNADVNAVPVPDGVPFEAAALLGCRFATAYRALVDRARLVAGETVVVLGCGGVGLSAVRIAVALGARVVAVDVAEPALDLARESGAVATVNAAGRDDDAVVTAIRAASGDGVHVAIEALGRAQTLAIGVRSLANGGRLVQIGLLASDPVVPMGEVVARELAVLGSHGMAAADYPRLLELVSSGDLHPETLVTRTISLDGVADALLALAAGTAESGVTMIAP